MLHAPAAAMIEANPELNIFEVSPLPSSCPFTILFSVLQWNLASLLGSYLGLSIEVNCHTNVSQHCKLH